MKLNKQEKMYKKPIEVTDTVENRSFTLLRLLGYILLVFALIDYIAIIIPLRLTDPAWEFQTIGQLVDHVWSPLLGIAFVFFYTQNHSIGPREIPVLRCLSWASLILGLLYILMLPLGINNSLTIYRATSAQITDQFGQQTEQIQKLNQQLDAANTPDKIKTIAKIINPQSNAQINATPQELKNKLSQQIQIAGKNVSTTANIVKQQQSISLIKNAVKVNLGAVLSGVCLITVWNLTRWVRILDNNVN